MIHTDSRNSDAGAKAREVMSNKDESTPSRSPKWIYLVAFLFVCAVTAVVGQRSYSVQGYHYSRACTVPTESGLDISGSRRYHNTVTRVFGIPLLDVSKAQETTRLDSVMEETTVVGIAANTWWSQHNPAAQPKVMILKDAETYVFNQNGKSYVVTYDDFCK